MGNVQLKFKVAAPKAKLPKGPKTVKFGGITEGIIRINENNEYIVEVKSKNLNKGKSTKLPFTPKSYEVKGKTDVFLKDIKDKGRTIRIIRNEFKAKFFPGDEEKYIPFAKNWIVKGYIVNVEGKLMFDFVRLHNIENFDCLIHNDDD